MTDARSVLTAAPVIPVLVIEDSSIALPLGEALVAGGLRVLEVTLRTEASVEAIRRMNGIDGAIVGAGTVLNAADAERAVEAGARFLISPGITEGVVTAATRLGVPIIPGIATASELMRGLDLGLTHFKFFPAVPAGGTAMLKALHGPFAAARFCPTGGIGLDNARDFLSLPNVLCVGGSWIAPAASVAAADWPAITALARAAAAALG